MTAHVVTLLRAVAASVSLSKTLQLCTLTGKPLSSRRTDAHHGQTDAETVKLTSILPPQASTTSNTPLLTAVVAETKRTPISTHRNHPFAVPGGLWEAALKAARISATAFQEVFFKTDVPSLQSGDGPQETHNLTTKLSTAQPPTSTSSETPSTATASNPSTELTTSKKSRW